MSSTAAEASEFLKSPPSFRVQAPAAAGGGTTPPSTRHIVTSWLVAYPGLLHTVQAVRRGISNGLLVVGYETANVQGTPRLLGLSASGGSLEPIIVVLADVVVWRAQRGQMHSAASPHALEFAPCPGYPLWQATSPPPMAIHASMPHASCLLLASCLLPHHSTPPLSRRMIPAPLPRRSRARPRALLHAEPPAAPDTPALGWRPDVRVAVAVLPRLRAPVRRG